jgi:hypothetical protein
LGYVVECALKACIAERFREHEVPERKLVNSFYTHKLDELVAISRLEEEFEVRVGREPRFAANWATVSEWNESVRYDILKAEARARGLHRAITEQEFGIFPWLRTRW